MKYWNLFLISCIGVSSCSNPVQQVQPNKIIVTLTEGGLHKTDNEHHYEIDIKYPVIDANVDPQILVAINNVIPERFNQFINRKEFTEAHLHLPEDFYSAENEWKGLLTNTYKVNQADSIIFLTFSVYHYFVGAAHGSTYQHSIIFDLSNGEEIHYSQFIKTDTASLQKLRKLFNSNLPDSICWGIQNDSSMIQNMENIVFISDSVLFYIDDYSICPNAFGIPDIRFSNEQAAPILKAPLFKSFREIQAAVNEGEIATH